MIRLGIFSSRRRHTRYSRDWSSDVCSSDLVAMVAGRTFAMAANRILDRHIDARKPRTANRELVTGAVSVRTAWTRSEERRVGKECRSRWSRYNYNKNLSMQSDHRNHK